MDPNPQGTAAKVAGNAAVMTPDWYNGPLETVRSTDIADKKQICVPSAKRTYSPLALLPRSMIAPVGTPPL